MSTHALLRDAHGQMAVELCVTLPVLLLVMVIAVDATVFFNQCAKFDHLAPQAVLSCATSTETGSYDQQQCAKAVKAVLEKQFKGTSQNISVSASSVDGAVKYTCTLEMTPWPLASGSGTFMGMRVPSLLSHSASLAVCPYEVGAIG